MADTQNALISASAVGAGAGIGPNVVQPIIHWMGEMAAWYWPGIPVPKVEAEWSFAAALCGVVSFGLTYWLQKKAVNAAVAKAVSDQS